MAGYLKPCIILLKNLCSSHNKTVSQSLCRIQLNLPKFFLLFLCSLLILNTCFITSIRAPIRCPEIHHSEDAHDEDKVDGQKLRGLDPGKGGDDNQAGTE